MDIVSYAKASSAYKLATLVNNELVNKVNVEGSSMLVPVGTTATRPVLGAEESAIRYNSDLGGLEGWTGTEWKNVSASITAVSLKGKDTEANILTKVGMVAEDLWIASDTLDGWVYDGSTWLNVGPLQGPQGIQGETGPQGATGNGVASIVKTATLGLVDTYTVTFTDATTTIFDAANGVDGLGVDHIAKTSGTGAGGTTDVYTVYADFAEKQPLGTFNVYNGANGAGTVAGVMAGSNIAVDNTDPTNPIVGLGANATVQGNTFNGAEQLVKLGVDGKLPAIDGSNLINMVGAVTSVAGKVGSVVLDTADVVGLDTALNSKQDMLISGTTIKTINSQSIIGIGDIVTPTTTINNTLISTSTTEALSANMGKTLQDTKQTTLVSGTNIKTVNGITLLGSGDLSTIQTTITGNSGTATKLETPRAINGVSFDGSANITVSDSTKQAVLVSGTNIKTINSSSILSSGNLALLTSTNPSITGSITEQVYNLTGTAINPANGTIQYKIVSANTTFTETLISGQSVLLRLINANSYTITFPTITWVGKTAPVLTANCVIVLWKEQTTLYGAYVGSLV